MSSTGRPRSRVGRLGEFLENFLLIALLVALIALAAMQIVLRNVFDSGVAWSDELLRLLVLWLAMAAAIAAARDDRHIAIDVLSRFAEGRWLSAVRVLVALFTAAVCAVLAWHAGRFVNDSRLFEDVLLGSVPAWLLQAIMPLAFGLMAYRYLVHAVGHLRDLLRSA